jgi:hypothetical protein
MLPKISVSIILMLAPAPSTTLLEACKKNFTQTQVNLPAYGIFLMIPYRYGYVFAFMLNIGVEARAAGVASLNGFGSPK